MILCCGEALIDMLPRDTTLGEKGFAPYAGGTLSYIDMMGTKAFVDMCKKLEKKCGERFKPNKQLVEMAGKGDTYYGKFAPAKREKAA